MKVTLTALQPEAALTAPHAAIAFTPFMVLCFLTRDPKIFTFFSLISNFKLLKVKTAILGLLLRFFLPYREEI